MKITSGRFDIQYATNILVRFIQQPREEHIKWPPWLFFMNHLKYNQKAKPYLDSTNLKHENIIFENHERKHIHPDAFEAMNNKSPSPESKEIQLTVIKDVSYRSNL